MLVTPSVSPTFGEHRAQLRMVGAAFYIDDLTFLGDRLSLPCVGHTQAARPGPISVERHCGLTSTTSWLPKADSRAGSPDPALQALPTASIAPPVNTTPDLDPCPAKRSPASHHPARVETVHSPSKDVLANSSRAQGWMRACGRSRQHGDEARLLVPIGAAGTAFAS